VVDVMVAFFNHLLADQVQACVQLDTFVVVLGALFQILVTENWFEIWHK
jgi:hypothetical protein